MTDPGRHGAGERDRVVRVAQRPARNPAHLRSERTPEGYKKSTLSKTLLNGNNICAVRGAASAAPTTDRQLIPGGDGPEA